MVCRATPRMAASARGESCKLISSSATKRRLQHQHPLSLVTGNSAPHIKFNPNYNINSRLSRLGRGAAPKDVTISCAPKACSQQAQQPQALCCLLLPAAAQQLLQQGSILLTPQALHRHSIKYSACLLHWNDVADHSHFQCFYFGNIFYSVGAAGSSMHWGVASHELAVNILCAHSLLIMTRVHHRIAASPQKQGKTGGSEVVVHLDVQAGAAQQVPVNGGVHGSGRVRQSAGSFSQE